MSQNSRENESNYKWCEVQMGFLSEAMAENRSRKTRRKALFGGVSLGLLCLIALGGFSLLGGKSELPYKGGIACAEMPGAYQEYLAGDASDDRKAHIAKHIDDCIICQRKYEQIVQSESEYSVSPALLAAVGIGAE